MSLRRTVAALALCLSAGVAATGWAQAVTATLLGTVTDSTGAVLPGVTLTVTNTGTSQQQTLVTDAEGHYQAPQLPPGPYRVTAELQGFKRELRQITLEVNQRQRLDLKMELGQMSEDVSVTAEAPQIQVETATVGTVVSSQQAHELPLNGRNFLQLNLLVPGAQTGAKGTTLGTQGGSIDVHGLRESSNYFWLDGIDNTTQAIGQLVVNPPTYSIEEFRVQSPTYDAEFGRTAGAQVNVVTRSGTNAYHGDAYEFLRNSALDAKNYFDPPGPVPPFRRNQYGVDTGGRLAKDRTFFFVGFEGLRSRQSGTFAATVPLPQMIQGNFSSLSKRIVDPQTGQPFSGNVIPSTRFDPIGYGIAQAYPAPNASGTRNLITNPIDALNDDSFIGRIDQVITQKNHAFVRFNLENVNEVQPVNLFSRTTNIPGFGRSQPATRFMTWGANDVHTFSSNLVGEFRFGWNRWKLDYEQQDSANDAVGRLGLPGISRKPIDYGFPLVTMAGVYDALGSATNLPQIGPFDTFQASTTFTYLKGTHTVKFGGDYHHHRSDFIFDSVARGQFIFTGRFTGDPLADLLLGLPTQSIAGNGLNGDTQLDFISTAYSGFVQDDWRVHPRLTVTAGARYEYTVPTVEGKNRFTNFDFRSGKVLVAGQNGASRATYNPDPTDVAPRVGFAWDLNGDGKWAMRGGYGLFYEVPLINQVLGMRLNPPWFTANVALGDGKTVTLENAFTNPANVTPNLSAFDQDYREGRVQEFSVDLQHQLLADFVIDVGYVGTRGDRLFGTLNYNQPLPGPGSIQPRRPYPAFANMNTVVSYARSQYDGLEIRAEKRFSRGFHFLTSYTFSHAYDNSSGSGSASSGGAPQNSHDPNADWGPSNFDVRHRLVMSFLYELPFGSGRHLMSGASGVTQALLGGWNVNGIVTVTSGQPFSPVLATDNSNTGQFLDRPNLVGDPYGSSAGCATRTVDCWVNPAAFAAAAPYTFGTAGRNSLYGPRFKNIDMSLVKQFGLGRQRQIEFRAEFFNLLNFTNFDNPNRVFGTPLFGQIFSAEPPRQIQFGVRFMF